MLLSQSSCRARASQACPCAVDTRRYHQIRSADLPEFGGFNQIFQVVGPIACCSHGSAEEFLHHAGIHQCGRMHGIDRDSAAFEAFRQLETEQNLSLLLE